MPYIPRLDTFRAIAVLLVVWYHYTSDLIPTWARTINTGGPGVWFFFTLSGYLITALLLNDRRPRAATLKNFYTRRAFRIFPLYYFSIAAGLILFFAEFSKMLPWLLTYTINIGIIYNQTSNHTAHFWTLAVEEQFYLLWPIALLSFRDRAWILLCALILASIVFKFLAQTSVISLAHVVSLLSCSSALGIGALAAIATTKFGIDRTEKWLRVGLPITVPMAIAFVIYHAHGSEAFTGAGASLFCAWLIVLAVKDGPEASSWGGRLLPLIGKISYGIYVYHLLVRAVLLDHVYGPWKVAVFSAASTILIAAMSFILLESPIRHLGIRLLRRDDSSRAVTPAGRLVSN